MIVDAPPFPFTLISPIDRVRVGYTGPSMMHVTF